MPDYAHLTARKALGDRLVESFKLSRGAAMAIANSVIDPAAVRKGIGGDFEPVAERIAVPGGTILGPSYPGLGTQGYARPHFQLRCAPEATVTMAADCYSL